MKRLLILVSAIIIVVLAEVSSLLNPIENGIGMLTRSLMLSSADTISPFTSSEGIAQARDQQVREYNEQLKKQLHFIQQENLKTIGAQVYGYSTDPLRSHILIDQGAEQGIERGFPVIATDGLLYGVIAEVHSKTSFVLPVTDSRNKILGIIPRSSGSIHGIVQGQFHVGAELTHVPVTEELRSGDIVLTSGLQEKIPQGLVIGTIQEIRKKPEQLFQTAVLSLPFPSYPPRYVSVIFPSSEESSEQ